MLTGLVGAFVSPWVGYAVDRRKARAEQLRVWREGLGRAERDGRVEDRSCIHDEWYMTLRPHLSAEVVKAVEYVNHSVIYVTDPRSAQPQRGHCSTLLAAEIDAVDKRWGSRWT